MLRSRRRSGRAGSRAAPGSRSRRSSRARAAKPPATSPPARAPRLARRAARPGRRRAARREHSAKTRAGSRSDRVGAVGDHEHARAAPASSRHLPSTAPTRRRLARAFAVPSAAKRGGRRVRPSEEGGIGVADVDPEADRGALGTGGAQRGEQVGEHAEEGHGAHPAQDAVAAPEQGSRPPATAAAMTSGQRAPKAWCRPGAK